MGRYLIVHDRSKTHDAQSNVIGRFTDLILLQLAMQTSGVRTAQGGSFHRRHGVLVGMMVMISVHADDRRRAARLLAGVYLARKRRQNNER